MGTDLPREIRTGIAIVGAGPIGLDAALAASEAGHDFMVLEASAGPAGSVREWGHVQLFTPWSMNVSARMRSALEEAGQVPPDGNVCPTGRELVDQVLAPVAALPTIAPHVRYGMRVLDVSRDGPLKNDLIGSRDRNARPFRLLVDRFGSETALYADIVLDCSGTFQHPNALGAGGIPALGERSCSDLLVRRIPDLAAEEDDWAGLRILLVGGGHSGQTAAVGLADLVGRRPDTTVWWVLREHNPSFPVDPQDPLPGRSTLAASAHDIVTGSGPVRVLGGLMVDAMERGTEGLTVHLRSVDGTDGKKTLVVDRILGLTGSVGDHSMYRQLQVHECWATSGTMKLAATLLASDSADCLDQVGHGPDVLRSPEPDFFVLGSKSYGRTTTFLLRIGWEQVDDVFSILPNAAAAARDSGDAA